jgi:hypothetical protein
MALRMKITIHFVWNISSSSSSSQGLWPVVHLSHHHFSGSQFKLFLICAVSVISLVLVVSEDLFLAFLRHVESSWFIFRNVVQYG